jgi:hypothetical protein
VDQENTVTVIDPKDPGKRTHLQVPVFGTEESKKFWTPVLLGLKERLAKEGMEKSLCLGHFCDGMPFPRDFKVFADILGEDVQWFRQGHQQKGALESPEPLAGGGRVGLHFFTYLPHLPDPQAGTPTADKVYWPRAAYFRAVSVNITLPVPVYRSFAAASRFLHTPGFGYLGLDYWLLPGSTVPWGVAFGRWQRAGAYPGELSPQYITWAGPDGAEPLTIYQAIREGLQETEAMCVISAALEKDADKLGADLAGRCRQALKDELTYCRDRCGWRWDRTSYQVNHYGWQELSQRVFTLAGEVAAKTAGK